MLRKEVNEIDSTKGLPEELFLEISTLIPIPNVDLFILDDLGRVLLTRRDDVFFGKGWHLPGGCIRFKETMLERVRKTALSELGCSVRMDEEPLTIKDVIIKNNRKELTNQNLRAHQLSVLYRCYVVDANDKLQHMIKNNEAGWFKRIPKDILAVHDVYRDVFEKYHLL